MAWIQAVPGSRPGERADDSLAVQRDPEALVAHVALDDVGNGRFEQHLTCFGVVGEELLERGAIGSVADPGVAGRITAGSKSRPDAPEQLHVRDVPVDVVGSERMNLGGVVSSSHCVSADRPRTGSTASGRTRTCDSRASASSSITSGCSRPTRCAHGLMTKRGSLNGTFERARATDLIAALEHDDRPARARYAAAVSPLWPPATTTASRNCRQLRGFRSRHRAIMPGCPPCTPEQARRVYDRIAEPRTNNASTRTPPRRARRATPTSTTARRRRAGLRHGPVRGWLLAGDLPADAPYVGVDLSPADGRAGLGPARAVAHCCRVTLVDGGASLPAADGAADRFVANYVFDLLVLEARAALAEARRVLGAGWAAVPAPALTPGENGLAPCVAPWTGRVGALARPRRRLPPDPARRRAEPGRLAGPPSRHGRGLGA